MLSSWRRVGAVRRWTLPSVTRRRFFSSKTTKNSWNTSTTRTVALVSVSLATGYILGRSTTRPPQQDTRLLPSGLPRTCCEEEANLTPVQRDLPGLLKNVVGEHNVILRESDVRPFCKGMRMKEESKALCVVTPHLLHDVVRILPLIIKADCTVLVQGANTGLTGGSVPRFKEKRPTVIISTQHLSTIFPLDNGKRVVCLAGAGLADLSKFLEKNFPDRESHSTLGSTFLNPTVAAGVALGSGGTECCRKGSAYTDRSMYVTASKNKWGEVEVKVVNTLGIEGLEDEDFVSHGRTTSGSAIQQLDIYARGVKEGYRRNMCNSSDKGKTLKASDNGYAERLCISDETVSRCNADTRGSDCNRSEGKVLILATVHDTFPKARHEKSFWISFDSLETALRFRQDVCLKTPQDIPTSMEYLDRDAFDVVDRSGRVLAGMIRLVGPTSSIVKHLWNIKLWMESLPFDGAPLFCDRILHAVNNYVPATLPSRIMDISRVMDHHVAVTVGDYGDGSMKHFMERLEKFKQDHSENVVIHECKSDSEATSLTAFRFVAAAAFRTWCVGEGLQGFSVDYALPKNGGAAPALSATPVKRMRYSHFGCNVVHEDLAFDLDVDADQVKMKLKETVEHECHGKLPAEHGHGTEYKAPPETQERWKRMDPLNVMNPGIGGLSTKPEYKE